MKKQKEDMHNKILKKTLFPEEGSVNIQFYEQTLIQQKSTKREEIAIDEIEEEELDDPDFVDSTFPKEILKDTSDQLEKS